MPADLAALAHDLASAARAAGLRLGATPAAQRTDAIRRVASALRANVEPVLAANARDLAAGARLDAPVRDRLALDAAKVEKMARAVDAIAAQPDPVGATIDAHTRPDGLRVARRRVPLGAVLFCYESRPNVTTDAAALCLRSGNAVVLRGGKESAETNRAFADLVRGAVEAAGLPGASVQLVGTSDRALLPLLLKQDKFLDVVIPRGGESLIRAVVAESTVPVLKHFTGNCHLYLDRTLPPLDAVTRVVVDAKTGYPGGAVCNAVEHLLVHEAVAGDVLPELCAALRARGVEVRGDALVRQVVPDAAEATDADWDAEYLAFVVGVKVVESLDEAIAHVNARGSHHTDGILTLDEAAAERFVDEVDSASVMVNASTRFADGGEYGLGAELGISTDKLHARGPMGAFDLCTYKWVVTGDGHVRG